LVVSADAADPSSATSEQAANALPLNILMELSSLFS
jgi:hypothetical protein